MSTGTSGQSAVVVRVRAGAWDRLYTVAERMDTDGQRESPLALSILLRPIDLARSDSASSRTASNPMIQTGHPGTIDFKPFSRFLETASKVKNETQLREAFLVLAATGFDDTEFATTLALGAEYGVRFTQSGLVRRGSIDSYFGNLILEFEADLGKSRRHALGQLQAYVAGAWREDDAIGRPYLAVATDGIHWEVFTPRLAGGPSGVPEAIELLPSGAWEPPDSGAAASLWEFLNRLFFRSFLLKPTASNFAQDFGLRSPSYLAAYDGLHKKYLDIKARSSASGDPQLDVLFEAWAESLRTAYGNLEPDPELFIRHTYLAVLARLLVWASIERRPMRLGELDEVLGGQYFMGRGVANLVEDDFFAWYRIPSATAADSTWLALARQLAGYDLGAVEEDVLKPLYEQLVDPVTRHDLGEFYTPDWLATAVTDHLLTSWTWEKVPSVLDPTCGSGTFIRATIGMVRQKMESRLAGRELLRELLGNVMGIDVHPLAVTIARATYLLAIRNLLPFADGLITIPIYLANSLQMPHMNWQPSLFGENAEIEIASATYEVPAEFLRHGGDFDLAMEEVIEVAKSYGGSNAPLTDVPTSLKARLRGRLDALPNSDVLVSVLGVMTKHIAQLVREHRDTIHGFLLKNHYRPAMLMGSFDYVLGNPPWLTVNDISSPKYKATVIRLATEAQIAPRTAGEQAHTELATLFLATVIATFLKPWDNPEPSRVAFVMTRSVFNASQHRLLREGRYRARFNVSEIWDLEGVTPLFNMPTCVLFAASRPHRRSTPIAGMTWSGRLPAKDLSRQAANEYVANEPLQFELVFLGTRSAWRATGHHGPAVQSEARGVREYYQTRFRQGAILYPQTLLVVEPTEPIPNRMSTVHVRTNPAAARTAWSLRDARVNHLVDARNLFATAAAEHIMPFALTPQVWNVVLPTTTDPGNAGFKSVDGSSLRQAGLVHTAAWLDWAEAMWATARKASDTTTLSKRLDYLGHLSAQANTLRYLVLYTSQGNRPVATVLDRQALERPFVVRDMTYWTSSASLEEAMYLVGFLNSEFALARIQDWMTKGLFGARHIHKRILDVAWPQFDPNSKPHRELAKIVERISAEAASVAKEAPTVPSGRRRRFVRSSLDLSELQALEEGVAAISAEGELSAG